MQTSLSTYLASARTFVFFHSGKLQAVPALKL